MRPQLVLLLALTVLAAGLLAAFRDEWSLQPLEREAAYANISHAVTGPDGSVYTITDSKQTVQKVDKDGTLVYSIASSVRAQADSLQLFDSITADADGNAYALVTILNSYGLRVTGEQIIKISPSGAATSIMYRAAYPAEDQLLRVGNIQSLTVKDGSVYFFRKSPMAASLMQMPRDAILSAAQMQTQGDATANAAVVRTIEMPANRYLNELAGQEADRIFFTTKRGSLYAAVGQTAEQLYPPAGHTLHFPVGIVTRDYSNIYYIDYHAGAVMRINADQSGMSPVPILTMEELSRQYPDTEWSEFMHVSVSSGLLTAATSDRIIQLLPDGQVVTVLGGYDYPWAITLKRLAYWALAAGFVFLAFSSGRLVYIHLLRRRVSLLLKQMAVIVPVVLLSMIGLSYFVYASFSEEIKGDTTKQLELLAGNGKFLVDGAHLEQINSPRDFMSEHYSAIKQRMNDLFSLVGDNRDGLYNTIYRYMDGQLYIIMDDDDSVTMFQPFPLDEENLRVLEHGEIVTGEWQDSSGQWMYALGPLYNSSGDIIGIYETGKDMIGMKQSNARIMNDMLAIIALVGVVLLLVITMMTAYLLSSIRKLRRSVNLIASGEWDVKVQIHTRDEVEELGQRFNMMASSIRQYIQEVTKLSNSYFRFVPQQFLKVLGKTNMTQISLGEQANRDMTILVCNMRGFSELSTRLTTEENFRFINSFLNVFGPVVRECGGFTSRYLGPGMLTMFPDDSSAAIRAAVRLRAMLDTYNAERTHAGGESIDIGIAIHSGDVMIGIIGEEQRMEGSVVSNHVQLTLELEKLSAKLGVQVLLTEETMHASRKPLGGNCRKLGTFQIGDEQRTIELFDLYEGDPAHIRQLKQETKQEFEAALALFQSGRFYDAREGFVAVVKKNRYDLPAKHYFFACDRYFQEGVPAQWNNSLRIS